MVLEAITAPTLCDYMEYAGPEISVNLCIASLFSRQISIGNAGPTSTLESVGAKRHFRSNF